MKIDILGNGYVKNIDSDFNINQSKRLEAVKLAKVCFNQLNKEVKNPLALWDKLSVEGTTENPFNRIFEFIPVMYKTLKDEHKLKEKFKKSRKLSFQFLRFSYVDNKGYIYTNYRNIANIGLTDSEIAFNTKEELTDFKILEAKIPQFVFNHLKTHTQLTTIRQSDRYSKIDDFWLPDDIIDKLDKSFINSKKEALEYLKQLNYLDFESIFKTMGYKKEIYQRGLNGFRYTICLIGGWKNDHLGWNHLIELRSGANTQKETKEFIKAVDEVINNV